MGEAKERRLRGLPPSSACAIGAQRARRGVFPLPSGKEMVLVIPEAMSADDADAAATALTKLAMGLVEKAEGRPFEPTVPESCAYRGTPKAHSDVDNAGLCGRCLKETIESLASAMAPRR